MIRDVELFKKLPQKNELTDDDIAIAITIVHTLDKNNNPLNFLLSDNKKIEYALTNMATEAEHEVKFNAQRQSDGNTSTRRGR